MPGKVYTKTGDKGDTSLFGGTRVPKYHQRLEAYGTLDELNSHIGLIRDFTEDTGDAQLLLNVQNNIFSICAVLANEESTGQDSPVDQTDIEELENAMDSHLARLPELANFVLPGGHPVASYCHVARTVCRRAERNIIKLSTEVAIAQGIVVYVNRLSDYLFVLSRKILKDFNKEEILWQRNLDKNNK